MGTEKDIRSNFYSNNNFKNEFFIRRCTLEDLEGVIAVNEKELPEDYPYFFYKNILDNYSDSFLVAYSKENKVMGYIMWRVERTPSLNSLRLINKGHLVSLAVSKGYRKRGVATALLKESMPPIKKHNISEYVLEVRISNYNAIGLYKKFKYRTESMKKRYYRDGENAYYMILKA